MEVNVGSAYPRHCISKIVKRAERIFNSWNNNDGRTIWKDKMCHICLECFVICFVICIKRSRSANPIPIQKRMCHLCLEFAAAAAQWFTLHYNGLHWQQSAYLLHLYTLITSYTSYCNNLFNLGLGSSIKTLVIDNYKC